MFGIIYKATNVLNNKVYIGKTTKTLQHRKQQHYAETKHGCNTYFHKALRKHGEWFRWDVLGQCNTSDQLIIAEIECIDFFQSVNNLYGYNLSLGGEGNTNQKGKRCGKSNSFCGKHHTEETRLHLSAIKTGKYIGKDNHMYGKHHSEKTKQLLRTIACKQMHQAGTRIMTDAQKLHLSNIRRQYFQEGKISKPSITTRNNLRLRFSGKGNPSARTVLFLDPQKIMFVVNGEFNKFSKLNHIDPESFRAVAKGRKIEHKGWKVMYL